MSVFGEITTGIDLTKGITDFVKLWSPAYIAEIGRRAGFDGSSDDKPILQPFQSYETSPDENKRPEQIIPACIVVVPGLAGRPTRSGTSYRARWSVTLLAIVAGKDFESTDKLVKLYCAALRTLFVQKGSIGGLAKSTEWLDEDYDALDFEKSRTLRGGRVDLEVETSAVVDSGAGPIAVPDDPGADPGDYGQFETHHITTQGFAE